MKGTVSLISIIIILYNHAKGTIFVIDSSGDIDIQCARMGGRDNRYSWNVQIH